MRNLRILITFLFLSNYIYPIIPLRQNEIHTSPQTSTSNILLKIDSILERDFYLNAVKTHEIVLTGKATAKRQNSIRGSNYKLNFYLIFHGQILNDLIIKKLRLFYINYMATILNH
jgi:hypothetical protein